MNFSSRKEDGGGLRSWLEHPGSGHPAQVVANVVVIEDGNEIGHLDAVFKCLHPHGQLVAEVTHGSETHAGDPHVLAQSGGGFHIELVERHNAVNLLFPRQIGYRFDDFGQGKVDRDVEHIIQALARPVGIAQAFYCQQEYAAALTLAFAHEFLSLFVGGDAEKGDWRGFRHEASRVRQKTIPSVKQRTATR